MPPLCVGCSTLLTEHNLLCPRCWQQLHLITPPLCDRLGTPLPIFEDGPLISAAALADPPPFRKARAAAHYDGIIRRLIVRFKFEDRHEPLPLFIKLMQDAGRSLIAEADILVPVPLHRLRLLQRRYNQSAILARELARHAQKKTGLTLLKRIRRTKPQPGLSQSERQLNVANAFVVDRARTPQISGKKVLLIDDVMTTGATIRACAKALLNAGAAQVDVLAIALVTPEVAFEETNNQESLAA